ncbi:uncharacterized protein RJT21DRAFT_112688 [Scheffersomyces amazonensis]|uniref:uncharacterized protein n=1 Tax=Scheffersomyces amazonensis TaxID=1078765 RepID=UPI00315DBF7B
MNGTVQKVNTMETNIGLLDNRIGEVQGFMGTMNGTVQKVNTMEIDIDSLKKSTSTTSESLKTTTRKVNKMETSIKSILKKRMDNMESNIQDLNKEIQGLRSSNSELEKRIDIKIKQEKDIIGDSNIRINEGQSEMSVDTSQSSEDV